MMNLGDVTDKTIPKMVLISPPQHGGVITTRNFIPHTCHKAIGVLGAVSVATACMVPSSVTRDLAVVPNGDEKSLAIEHPTGEMTVVARVTNGEVASAGVLRTARKLFDGVVFPRKEN